MVGVNFDWSVVRKWRIDNSVRVEDLAKEIGTSPPAAHGQRNASHSVDGSRHLHACHKIQLRSHGLA